MRYFQAGLCEKGENVELMCEKYKQKMDSAVAECQHPDEYCKFRTSCLIHFMEKEKTREERQAEEKDHGD